MRLKRLEIVGFKSFAKKTVLEFSAPISSIVGPNGSGKSNVAEAVRFVLGEQSLKSMRGKRGEDLIFNGSQHTGKLNRAKVTITFDNTDRAFNFDFDEVVISREVFRDSSNRYYINDSGVRLKDVLELLSSVHIGASSHHIISQGEADRILNASPKDKKAMVEDALGLKIYHWKIGESEKKLVKTEENIKEVEMLRREIAPHLRYLRKQVEQIERARFLREELAGLYREYLKREDVYLRSGSLQIAENIKQLQTEHGRLSSELAELSGVVETKPRDDEKLAEIREIQDKLRAAREKKSEMSREIGRIEGMMEYEKRAREKVNENVDATAFQISARDVEIFINDLEKIVQVSDNAPYEQLKHSLDGIRKYVAEFREKHNANDQESGSSDMNTDPSALLELQKEHAVLQQTFTDLSAQEMQFVVEIKELQEIIEENKGQMRETERVLYEKKAELAQVESKIETLQSEEKRHEKEVNDFEEEIREGMDLLGARVKEFHDHEVDESVVLNEDRVEQESRRRKISVIKIRIEDLSGGLGEGVIKEHNDTKERDEFLARETNDLKTSAESLRELIMDLQKQLDEEFISGIDKINEQFQTFFELMFGGGNASLSIVADTRRKKNDIEGILTEPDETEEVEPAVAESSGVVKKETGLDITVSLPRKKIKGLMMLSGGERALTSIALLFAFSQVNPPPFMILDETDAALDEANSRKYGEMLENLSKLSQLIVITHNRETMSHAGILYGVTMDASAVSTLLSVKFEEAEKIAK